MKINKAYFLIIPISLAIFNSCKNNIKEDLSPVYEQSLSETWKFKAGEGESGWVDTDFDDSGWQEVSSSKILSEEGIKTDNGFGWYRKNIVSDGSLIAAIKNKGAAVIRLDKFASCEEIYVNGKQVGKTGEFPPNYTGYTDHQRNYLVMVEDLNLQGENLIAIKFNEGWGIGGFVGKTVLKISSADTNDKIVLDVKVADSDYIFDKNTPVSAAVVIENKNEWPVSGKLVSVVSTDDHKGLWADSVNIEIEGKGRLEKNYTQSGIPAGFYRCDIRFIRNEETVCRKKFNIGVDPESIISPVDAKADFGDFWKSTLAELAKVSPNYKLIHQPGESTADYDLYIVEMRSLDNELIRGYYAKPKREGKYPVIVEYMGYGSLPYKPNMSWSGFAHFVLSTRGQGLNQPTNRFGTWITYGLDKKENYYYRGAFMDVVRAIDFVSSRPEIDAGRIGVKGGSQGGAFTFAAAALDKRIKAAAPTIPFLSDYRDYFNITAWPRSDFEKYMKEHPETKWSDVYDLLTYFDIKNLAQWIECPLYMGIGVQDEVCPPHINFAAYNQVKPEKKWMAFPLHGHSVGKEYYEATDAFFKEKLNVN